ncbi:MAG: phosphate ABC transporter ATP-binding protein [Spirochaetales bacterium]|nr:phosphate ABC transporter ATP-binding protein [Spirochaetales bacterium]
MHDNAIQFQGASASAVDPGGPAEVEQPVIETKQLSVAFRNRPVIRNVDLSFRVGTATSIVGPSGSGKTSFLRTLNRIIEIEPHVGVTGSVFYHGIDIYRRDIDPSLVRRRIGMVFQRANPYPTSIWDNVAWGLHINGIRDRLGDRIEEALTRAALWSEVKKDLRRNALELSGGQQQRLCIARAIALNPDVLLFDEPTSHLDPVTAGEIEELIGRLKQDHTILVVTHDLNMAARVSDYVAFFRLDEEGVGFLEVYDSNINFFVRSASRVVNEYITRNQWMWQEPINGANTIG